MLAQLSQWLLIVALGQAPSEAALLKAAPADVDVAVRVRSLEAVHDDLLALIKAMDPAWANAAEGALAESVRQVREHHGAVALKSPFVGLLKFGEPGAEGGLPPFAILMPSDDYKATLKEILGGKDVELKHQDGDYEEFEGPEGSGTWYTAKGPGLVAFGTSKSLIAEIAKKGGKTLDSVLTGSAAKAFFGGDLGVYVNAATLTTRFADQIDQARQVFMAGLDQAAQQGGNAGAMKFAKEFYSGMFDSLKYADIVTLHLDLAAKGAHLAGFLKVKPDSDAARSVPDVHADNLASLDKLPAGAMVYAYMNMAAKTFERFQGMSLKVLSTGDKPSPALEKAMADFHGLGRIESAGSMSMDKGMRMFNDVKTEDPKKYIEASIAMIRAMSGGEGQVAYYKDLKVEPAAQTYEGLTFTHVSATMDVEKIAELSGNAPGQLETMKAMFGDGQVGFWYGTDGKRVLQLSAHTWDEARKSVDTYLKGEGGIGQSEGFKAVRSALPQKAGILTIFNIQSLVKTLASTFGAISKNPDLKVPEGMPKEPAFLGFSVTPHRAEGYELQVVIPSAVGPVVARGMIPVFQGMAPRGADQ